MGQYVSLIIGVLVFLYILYRQRQIRQVRQMRLLLPIILVVYGVSNLTAYFNSRPLTAISVLTIVISLLFLAVGMGAVRANTVKLWLNGSIVYRQGTWLTIGLWFVSVALHFAADYIGKTGEATLLIYYGITLAVQNWVVQLRARRSFPEFYIEKQLK